MPAFGPVPVSPAAPRGSPAADALSALANLGFRPAEAARAVAEAEAELGPGAVVDALIGVALKRVGNKRTIAPPPWEGVGVGIGSGVICSAMTPRTRRARLLRAEASAPERLMWCLLREAFPEGHWRRQVPLGHYFADFASHAARVVIEVDGGRHSEQPVYDERRTAFTEREGYRMLRFWSNEVVTNKTGVIEADAIALGPPTLPHEGGGL